MTDVLLKEGLFHVPESPDDMPYLIGSRCRVCEYTTFPRKKVCIRCLRDDTMEEIGLGRHGKLETFAIMRVGPPEFTLPYAVGYVRTDEGVRVFSQLTGFEMDDDALDLGEEMELVIDTVRKNEKGENVIGWKFRPVGRKSP